MAYYDQPSTTSQIPVEMGTSRLPTDLLASAVYMGAYRIMDCGVLILMGVRGARYVGQLVRSIVPWSATVGVFRELTNLA